VSGSDAPKSYLVECYWPGVSAERFASAAKRVQAEAATLRRKGGTVVFRGSILVPADESVFCLFDGIEADVRAASEGAGIHFERVLESLRIDGAKTEGEEEQ
jgi:hypothetical protein